jgi:hypothetical protein
MQRLFKKIILFVILIFIIISPFVWVNKAVINRPLNKWKTLSFSSNIDTLILGDSHAESSLDPNLIPGSINAAHSGENLFYTFFKLKYLVERNPGVLHKVILGFSYHNITKKYQEESIVGGVRTSFAIGEYYHFIDSEGKKRLSDSDSFMFYRFKYDFGIPLMLYEDLTTRKSLFSESAKPRGFGGFRVADESKLDENQIFRRVNSFYLDNNSNYTGDSEIMIDSLEKIAVLCDENKIRLYLYNAPLNSAYRRLVPLAAYESYDKVLKSLKSRYPTITIIDMSQELIEDKFFKDGDHLNKNGSKIASRILLRQL